MLRRPKAKPHPAQNRAPQHEAQAARRLGGHVVKGSGSGFTKGDVRVPGVLRLECKTTSADSFRLTREIVRKIEDATAGTNELPCVEVEFLNAKGEREAAVCVMPSWALEMLTGGKADVVA